MKRFFLLAAVVAATLGANQTVEATHVGAQLYTTAGNAQRSLNAPFLPLHLTLERSGGHLTAIGAADSVNGHLGLSAVVNVFSAQGREGGTVIVDATYGSDWPMFSLDEDAPPGTPGTMDVHFVTSGNLNVLSGGAALFIQGHVGGTVFDSVTAINGVGFREVPPITKQVSFIWGQTLRHELGVLGIATCSASGLFDKFFKIVVVHG